MNRIRALLLTAYLVFVVAGAAVYVQSVSNMILYTDADQKFPYSINVENLTIPEYAGSDRSYNVSCKFRFDNPSGATIILRAFSFIISVDNGEPGSPFSQDRLLYERIGSASTSMGDAGPRIQPGGSLSQSFLMAVQGQDAHTLNHLNDDGNYTVVVWDLVLSYGFEGTTLTRQNWLPPMVLEVVPGE